MVYNYLTEKSKIFTEEGQVDFITVRDQVNKMLNAAGAVSMMSAISGLTGDSWTMMAYVDRLVELKEIREVTEGVAGQNRIFVKA